MVFRWAMGSCPTGEVAFDPDAQARAVIQLLFEPFDDVGSLYGLFHDLIRHHIWLPVRARSGPPKGQLHWRRPSLATLSQVLHHPIYAGAYAYGRRPVALPGACSGPPGRREQWVPMDQWTVLIQDHLPASITWAQYLKNQERLKQNQSGPDTRGTPREGVALLAGSLVCGMCGRRMHVSYRQIHQPYYHCLRHFVEATEPTCPGVQAAVRDSVRGAPGAPGLGACRLRVESPGPADVERERAQRGRHWQQQVHRACYEVDLAERRYQAVDPANRLVAVLWSSGGRRPCGTHDSTRKRATASSRRRPRKYRRRSGRGSRPWPRISRALWQATGTTHRDRQAIIRCLVDHVVVHVQRDKGHIGSPSAHAGGPRVASHRAVTRRAD